MNNFKQEMEHAIEDIDEIISSQKKILEEAKLTNDLDNQTYSLGIIRGLNMAKTIIYKLQLEQE